MADRDSVFDALRSRRAVAAVEFAIVAPLLVLLALATAEAGLAMRDELAIQEAASAGAQAAVQQSAYDAAAITAAAAGATKLAAVSVAPMTYYGCPAGTSVTKVAQGAACSDSLPARHFLDVTATAPRRFQLGVLPVLGTTVSARATVRLPS